MRTVVALFLVALLAMPVSAAETTLPVRRVVLYKHGVGYFEREGKLDGVSDVTLQFKESEMSDVLKSLTILSAGGAVTGVSYEASDPLNRQLAEFGFTLPKDASIGQVLDQFKGARLAVKLVAGGEISGGILGVHPAQLDKSDTELITLLLDSGELRSIGLRDISGMRLEDQRMQQQLQAYLQFLRTAQRRDLRLLQIHSGGARELAVGYVVQAPVWKSSYRIVLDAQKPREALLQGWAIVDNTSGEDWKGVTLALVSGLPVSFTQNLYQAYYVNRPNVPLPIEVAAAPREYEGAVVGEEKDKELRKSARQEAMVRSMPAAAPMMVGGVNRMDAPREADFIRSVNVAATGRELGELFEYRMDHPVDVPRNGSAMIPFFQGPVKIERVLLYSPGGAGEHPYDAVLLENSTGKTLDGGAITVIQGAEYAGEGLIQTMKTGDSRPVSFAVDLGTRITTAFDSRQNYVYSVKVRRGTVSTKAKNVETRTYTARNTGGHARTLVIEHPVRPGWKLVGDTKPFETTAQNYRFRVELPATETSRLKVQEEYEISNTMALTNVTPDLLAEYVRNEALSPAGQKQLQQMFAVKEQIVAAQSEIAARQEEINEMFRDQERLRQNINNLRSLPGQQDQVTAYVAKLTSQEKQLEAKSAALTAGRTRVRQLQAQLDQLMNSIMID